MVFDCLPLCPSPSVCVSLGVYVPSLLCVAGLVAIATAVCSALIGPVIQSHPKHHPQLIMGSGLIMVTSISLTVTLAFIKIHVTKHAHNITRSHDTLSIYRHLFAPHTAPWLKFNHPSAPSLRQKLLTSI